jgi:uncharacterized membrane protein YhdT
MRKIEISDIIIWISIIVLIAYLIGKLTGLINTPEWVTLIPVITLIFFVGAFYQKLVSFMEAMYLKTDYLKKNQDAFATKIGQISNTLSEHEHKFSTLEKTKKK